MKDSTVRTWVASISIMTLAFVLSSKATTPAKLVGILLSLFALFWVFAVTSRWRRFLIGEQVDDAQISQQQYGNMGVS